MLKFNDEIVIFLGVVVVFLIFWGCFEWWRDYKKMDYKEFFRYLISVQYLRASSSRSERDDTVGIHLDRPKRVSRESSNTNNSSYTWGGENQLNDNFLGGISDKLKKTRRELKNKQSLYLLKIKEFKEKVKKLPSTFENKNQEMKKEEIKSQDSFARGEKTKVKIEGTFSKEIKTKPIALSNSLSFNSSLKEKSKKEEMLKKQERVNRKKNRSFFEIFIFWKFFKKISKNRKKFF